MKSLVYRELLRSRKVVLFAILTSLTEGAFFILVALSFRVGNLALVPDAIHDSFFGLSDNVLLPLQALLSSFIMMSAANADNESCTLWRMFRRSTPVAPQKFACAKFIMLGCWLLLSAVLAFLMSWLLSLAADISFTLRNVAVETAILEVMLLLAVIFEVLQVFSRASRDKVGLMFTAISVIPIVALGLYTTANDIDLGITPDKLFDLCETLLPFTPLILAVIFGAGILLTTAAYRRREK